MDPLRLVDRREVLRRAAALAGSVVSGAALAACLADQAPDAGPAATAGTRDRAAGPARTGGLRDPSGSGRPGPPGAERSSDQQPRSPVEPGEANPTDTQTQGADPSSDPKHRGEPVGSDGQQNGGGGRPDASDGGGGRPDVTDGGSGDPGGPPPLVAIAAVPVGGGVVLGPSRVVVTQPVAGEFRCFGSRCTHAGCTVDTVSEGTIHCPCHGSLFDIGSGEPVAGPAGSALGSVPIMVKSGGVYLA